MSTIIEPGNGLILKLEISCNKKLEITDEDERKIKELVYLYLKGKMNNDK